MTYMLVTAYIAIALAEHARLHHRIIWRGFFIGQAIVHLGMYAAERWS